MKLYTVIDRPGTRLSYANPLIAARRGAGMYWCAEALIDRLRHFAEGVRVLGSHLNVDLPSAKQAPIHVPQRSRERSP